MTKQKYRSKTGRDLYRPCLTLREAEHLMIADEMTGWCLVCGTEQDNVEPDAERYRCEGCGDSMVFGVEQLILRGIALVDGERAR
jgi:Zn finger protein HypA/HybF involved in hydrogenase expression